MRKVAILQHRLLHYRATLFNQLRQTCATRNIDLHLVVGQASRRETTKKDEGFLPWAHKVHNRFIEASGRDLLWQPLPDAVRDADLIVVMQESRILSNYPLQLTRLWSSRKIAYWGHGKNFQSDAPQGLREQWKRFLIGQVDWWFAYTQSTLSILQQAGYPQEQITCLDNAIDNEGFSRDLASIPEHQLDSLRQEIGADSQSPIGLFCGSLYADKRLEFMIAAADQIHAVLPGFRLVVVGDGAHAAVIHNAALERPWIKWAGVCKGTEKAAWFRLAKVIFNPGAVGLHVLDAFCAGIPMATTLEARHGPEIAYLENGFNGVITQGSPDVYAQEILRLLTDHTNHENLCRGATESARKYTLHNMVNQFADGIERCLNSPSRT